MYFAAFVDSYTPNQNGWVPSAVAQNHRNPAIYDVLRRHSCRNGNRQEDANSVWYVNAEGKRIRRKKTPREKQIDRESKFSQGTFDVYYED